MILFGLTLPVLLVALVVGYLLGSIPFGVIVTRVAGVGDVRSIGSGNIGATNVLRTGRQDLAAMTLVGDAGKAMAAVAIVRMLYGEDASAIAGASAFLGHLFPVWLGFKGGKGVATYIGVLLGLFWPGALAFCAVWLVVAWLTRYSSAAALIASAVTPPLLWLDGHTSLALLFALLSVLLWFMHRANLARLRTGTEGKIGAKTPPANESAMAGHNGGPPLGNT